MTHRPPWQFAVVVALSLLLPSARTQTGTVFPSTEFTYGSFTSDLLVCYSNSINSQAFRLTPITRTFTFVPTAGQMNVRFIQLMSPDFKKFYAQIVNGGIGTANPTSTDIVVSSVHGGFLNDFTNSKLLQMQVRYIRVASKTQQLLSARIVQGGVNMTSVRPISVALTTDFGGRLNAEILAYCG
uniref:Uncharacterized protein n=1 Tax=Anopheles epiroticus TaxID=199890 RepID=A0A182PHR1_9DIPT